MPRSPTGLVSKSLYLLNEQAVEAVKRRVVEELLELHAANHDLATGALAAVGSLLGAGSGDEDLVAGHVSGGSVVLAVRDTPRVVGDEDERVKDQAHRVVDGLGGGEGLMSACEKGGSGSAQLPATVHLETDSNVHS